MNMPLVSCICPTYNRPPSHQHLVEEAIESFLRQDYSHKELIVLNDTPGQELYCDAESVVVVNVPRRFRTLGEKWNAAASLSYGDLIAPWDDDDISLPWRLSYSVERLGDADYFNPRRYWNLIGNRLRYDYPLGYAHNASLFTRAAFEAVGGHDFISLGLDRYLDTAFVTNLEHVIDPVSRRSTPPTMSEWFYIYRWGVSPAHVSAHSDGDGKRRYQEIGTRPIQSGCFYLHPHWQRDYLQDTRDVLDQLETAK